MSRRAKAPVLPLKVLQEASDDSSLLVGSPARTYPIGKYTKISDKKTVYDKENVRQLRSGRGKYVPQSNIKSSTVNARGKSKALASKVFPVSLQTTFFSDTCSDSTLHATPEAVPHKKPRKNYKFMVEDNASNEYWKEIAIQREEALEEVLNENAKLRDNIQVLETQMAQYIKTVEDAKILAQCVQEIMS